MEGWTARARAMAGGVEQGREKRSGRAAWRAGRQRVERDGKGGFQGVQRQGLQRGTEEGGGGGGSSVFLP